MDGESVDPQAVDSWPGAMLALAARVEELEVRQALAGPPFGPGWEEEIAVLRNTLAMEREAFTSVVTQRDELLEALLRIKRNVQKEVGDPPQRAHGGGDAIAEYWSVVQRMGEHVWQITFAEQLRRPAVTGTFLLTQEQADALDSPDLPHPTASPAASD